MRTFLLALLLLLGVFFIFGRLTEVEEIGNTLQHGDLRFILLALFVEVIWLLNVAASYRAIYRTIGLKEKMKNLFFAAAGANFVNVVAPTAGMGGMAVFVSEARRRGYSPARTTVAGVLYILLDYLGFLCVLALGLMVLFKRNSLNSAELIASGVLMLLAIFIGTILFLGMRSTDALASFLAWLARLVNRILHPILRRPYLSEGRAREFAHDAREGLKEIHNNPESLLVPAGLALSNKVLLISILLLMFLAFNVPISLGTLIAGFSVAYLFFIVSPTPAGVGIVEGALAFALHSMYIPLSAAAVIALSYRGITFWIPMAFGGIALRVLHQR